MKLRSKWETKFKGLISIPLSHQSLGPLCLVSQLEVSASVINKHSRETEVPCPCAFEEAWVPNVLLY